MYKERKVNVGNYEIFDSFSTILYKPQPLRVSYDHGTGDEITLIFNFTLLDDIEEARPLSFEPYDGVANFTIDLVKGKGGSMTQMRPIAESKLDTLLIFISFKTSKKGVVDFKYTLYSEKKDLKSKSTRPSKSKVKK